jgi:hypothetical protein
MSGQEYIGSRLGATVALLKNDVTEGIEGRDMIGDGIRGVRNGIIAAWHGLQGIIPSMANAFSNQQFAVVRREGPLHGTANSVRKIFATRGILGKASAVLAEATDGPVDDGISAVTGGAQWIVKPVSTTRSKTESLFALSA